jgi:hypothetical protein
MNFLMLRIGLTLVLGWSCVLVAPAAAAAPPNYPHHLSTRPLDIGKTPHGRPKVHLDRLEFPEAVAGSSQFKKHLRRVLNREVKRVDWGAGRDNRIEYRFSVTKLKLASADGVLKVSCSATGALPGGKTAKSQLAFGGSPHQRNRVIRQVLEIVARGVVTRLAELERKRRGLE